MTDYKGIKTFDELIEKEHGKIGTDSRNEYEEGAQMFIVSEMLKEARKSAKLTQEQLAVKAGTKTDGESTNRHEKSKRVITIRLREKNIKALKLSD